MKFEKGSNRPAANRRITNPANPFQLVTKPRTHRIGAVIGPIQIMHASKHARRHHWRGKTAAFFIRPIDNFNRMARCKSGFIEAANNFQRGQNAKRPIIFSACWLSVKMAANHHRWQAGITAFAAGKHIAHFIGIKRQAFGLAP